MSRSANDKRSSTEPSSGSQVFRLSGGRLVRQSAGGVAPKVSPTPANPPEATKPRRPSVDQIRDLAYAKWEAAGQPPGDGTDFWLAAERELTEETAGNRLTTPSAK